MAMKGDLDVVLDSAQVTNLAVFLKTASDQFIAESTTVDKLCEEISSEGMSGGDGDRIIEIAEKLKVASQSLASQCVSMHRIFDEMLAKIEATNKGATTVNAEQAADNLKKAHGVRKE